MRICVVMFYDDNIKNYGDINYEINKNYCKKYGLDIIVSHKKTYDDNRHPAWERLPLLLKYIDNYDYMIWIDADAFFYPDADNIVDFINKNSDFNFIFSNDITGLNVNTGIFIVKNSDYSKEFLERWAYDDSLFENNTYPHWWDQGVLIAIINNNLLDIKNNSICIDYGILQEFYPNEFTKAYIYHLAGIDCNTRVSVSENYIKQIKIL
jgi:hypothetical protein